MRIKYSLGGQIYIYQYFLSIVILIVLYYLINIIDQRREVKNLFIIIINFDFICGLINLWLHPIVKIENDGLLIKRLGFIKRKIKWVNFKLYKRLRTITRYGMIGLDPRYALVKVKDATFWDNRVIILPFFKEYDRFIYEIEKNLDPQEVYTDNNYQ